MQCEICFRTGGRSLPFLCATDARNKLYLHRLQNAQVLLENDALNQEVSGHLSKSSEEGNADEQNTSAARYAMDTTVEEKEKAIDRTQEIIAHADELRAKIEQARAEVAKKKASIARKRSELASATNGTDARRSRQSDEVEKSIRMTKYKWNGVHSAFASSRTYLCGEAAKLYGLRRRKSSGQEEYQIGHVGIIDLRALNSASPAQISTSISHIVQILMLCMHYLAIRLPAEINLPRPEHPLPTIYSIGSSHMHRPSQTPGGTPGQSSNVSPTASKHEQNLPRPRPLYLTKPLPILLHENPAAYSLFLEGVVLLAYNIAWVCRSQGVPVGENCDFDDICNMGKNLYNLLIAPKARSQGNTRVSSNSSTPSKTSTNNPTPEEKRSATEPLMGRYSHGTATHFLGGAEGSEFMRSCKLPTTRAMTDSLKSLLQNEVANKEWEVLDQGAWEITDDMGGDGVVVGTTKEGGEPGVGLKGGSIWRGDMQQSFMSCRTVTDGADVTREDGKKPAGTSGWTKLKPR